MFTDQPLIHIVDSLVHRPCRWVDIDRIYDQRYMGANSDRTKVQQRHTHTQHSKIVLRAQKKRKNKTRIKKERNSH